MDVTLANTFTYKKIRQNCTAFWKDPLPYLLPTTYNPGQNIWNKMEKLTKTGQGKKSLVSIFACFLTTITKV